MIIDNSLRFPSLRGKLGYLLHLLVYLL